MDMPDLTPTAASEGPKFRILTKAFAPTPPTEGDGKRRFRLTLSSTIVDRSGDEIEMSALQKMADQFREGRTIFMDHKRTDVVDAAFGLSDSAELIQRGFDPKTNAPIWDLDVGGVVNTPNPRAVQLADSIDGGFVRLGASVTAIVRKHQAKPTRGMKIADVDVLEGSVVGVGDNPRAWAHKAAVAVKSYGGNPEDEEDIVDPIEDVATTTDEATEPVVEKADMSAKTRNNLPDSEFACPEQRKYPINDKAHVRAALSRIADPSNEQCGKAKILAAAKRMGIGQHGETSKAFDGDAAAAELAEREAETALLAEAATWAGDITLDADGFEVIEKDLDSSDATSVNIDSTSGAQESASAEAPETALEPAASGDDGADTRSEKAYDPAEVKELVSHVSRLVTRIGELETIIAEKDAKIAAYEADARSVSEEVKTAAAVIGKVMEMPLRARTAEYVEKNVPDLFRDFPEVSAYLSKRSHLSE